MFTFNKAIGILSICLLNTFVTTGCATIPKEGKSNNVDTTTYKSVEMIA